MISQQELISDDLDSLLINDAMSMSQGLSEYGIFRSDFIDTLVKILKNVRQKFPEISNIHSDAGAYNNLYPSIINETNNPFKYRHQKVLFPIERINLYLSTSTTWKILLHLNLDPNQTFKSYDIKFTGIKTIDEFNKKYGASNIQFYISKDIYRSTLRIQFNQNLDILKLIQIYSALPEVNSAHVTGYVIGMIRNIIYFLKKESNWHFVFIEKCGWECRNQRFHYFTYNLSTKEISKDDEVYIDFQDIEDIRENVKIWHFGIPKWRYVSPFKNYNDLRSTAKSNIWWEKLYALDVMGYLMLSKFVRYNVDDQQKVDETRNKVLSNRKEIIKLFISNLSSSDRDISKTVYTYLCLISNKTYSITDIEKWTNWFNEHWKYSP